MSYSAPLIACHECDLLQLEIALPPGEVVLCSRCGAHLYRSAHSTLDKPLAYLLTAVVALVVANVYPIVGLAIQGTGNATTLFGAAHALWNQGMAPIAVLVFLTTFLVPVVELSIMGYLLLSLKCGHRPDGMAMFMRILEHVNPWGMVEVFILGVIVALVKLTHYGTVIPDMALWAFGVLTLLLAATVSSFDNRDIWSRVDALPLKEVE
ncbi:MAG: paraquat-inducible protein A [Desulfuromonadaceae bacterium]